MNNNFKAKSRKSDKSPRSRTPSCDSMAKGTSGASTDSNQGNTTPLSTPAHSPFQLPGNSHGGSSVQAMAVPSSAGLLSPAIIKPSPTLWFTTEIQHMMYGFGDCRKPLAESAGLVEEIVHQQMALLLYQAEEVGKLRNARFLGIEDFLFLLRKDKVKLRRLLRYMTLKDLRSCATKQSGVDDDDMTETGQEMKAQPKKRKKICYDFLSMIDQTGELVSLLDDDKTDEVKHERALRAELMTRGMDAQQYLEFCEARQASFTPRFKQQKFKDWLIAGVSLDIKPNPMAMEVLSYLAYEIVAQVVDLALLVRRDSCITPDNPFSVAMPAACINHDCPPTSPADGSMSAGNTVGMKSPTPKSDPPSPPATPTTPMSLGSSGGLNMSVNSQSSLNNKPKPKKKKKSGSCTRDVSQSTAISPGEIREALRRYGQCIGPFADFSKCPILRPVHKLLCC